MSQWERQILIVVIGISTISIQAQDIHFSQFFLNPLQLNPAHTGNYAAMYRFTGLYRNQWQSVTVPYRTFSLSAERNALPIGDSSYAAGILIMNDRTGDSRFTTTLLNFSFSRHWHLSSDSSWAFFAGIQPGFIQKSIREDALRFDRQYNGMVYDPALPTYENFSRMSLINPHLSVGLLLRHAMRGGHFLQGGIAFHNLLPQKESFFRQHIILDRRFNVHLDGQWNFHYRWSLQPSAMWQTQGKFKETLLGASFRYSHTAMMAFYGGLYIRNKDAAYIRTAVDYQQWHVSVSYDLNYSKLKPASYGRGGIEIAVIYLFSPFRPSFSVYKHCPVFL